MASIVRRLTDTPAGATRLSRLWARADRLGLRVHLLVLVLGCFLPLLAFAGYVAWDSAERDIEADDARMLATARALAVAVEGKLGAAQAALQVLAASSRLKNGDLEGFHTRAQPVARAFDAGIAVVDREHQLVNTRLPFGTPLPPATGPGLPKVELGAPKVTDLFASPLTGRPTVAVAEPVLEDGELVHAVVMTLGSTWFEQILARQNVAPGWLMTIIDRNGKIVARSIDTERFAGQPVPPEFFKRILRDREGVANGVSKAGVDIRGAFTHTMDGWTVSMAVEQRLLQEPLHRSLTNIAVGGGMILLMAGAGALWWGYRLSHSTAALRDAASALGRGEPLPEPGRLVYREAAAVMAAQRTAAVLLEERAAERDRSHAELQALATGLEQRVAERTEALVLARDEAHRANRAKSEFLASMSHELRTPLNAVLGFAQLLQYSRDEPLSPGQTESVEHILRGGHHLLALINDVLDLAKIEAGKLRISMEPVGLESVLDELAETLEPVAHRAAIAMTVAEGAAGLVVRADRSRLLQVLLNLGSNAIKYNRQGGTVTVEVTGAQDGTGLLRIVVVDTGLGIPADRQHEVFEPFNRLGAERSAIEGTGIGLSICRRLVEMMGGRMGFSSREGEGSRFWVELARDAAPAAAAPTTGASPLRGDGPVRTVLYVEDNPTSVVLMSRLMAALPGMRLLTAPTGEIGCAVAIAHRPDVVIVDIHLPDISGYDVLARLRALPETAAIPVLCLTADAMPRDRERGLAAGFHRYMTKPLDVAEMVAAIHAAAEPAAIPAAAA